MIPNIASFISGALTTAGLVSQVGLLPRAPAIGAQNFGMTEGWSSLVEAPSLRTLFLVASLCVPGCSRVTIDLGGNDDGSVSDSGTSDAVVNEAGASLCYPCVASITDPASAPTCNLSAAPASGSEFDLSWSTAGASSVVLVEGGGFPLSTNPTGRVRVLPSSESCYTLISSNSSGTACCEAIVRP